MYPTMGAISVTKIIDVREILAPSRYDIVHLKDITTYLHMFNSILCFLLSGCIEFPNPLSHISSPLPMLSSRDYNRSTPLRIEYADSSHSSTRIKALAHYSSMSRRVKQIHMVAASSAQWRFFDIVVRVLRAAITTIPRRADGHYGSLI